MAGIVIERACVGFEREPLKSAFGFKGSALTYLLQSAVALYGNGEVGVGAGVQSVLWSDARIFAKHGEDRGNELMYSVTRHGVELLRGKSFDTPYDAIDYLIPRCYEFATSTCGDVTSETFVLNALVPIDFALWMLYARLNKMDSFDGIFPSGKKQSTLANIPLITYGTQISDVTSLAKSGVPIFKIKIGSDPEHDRDPEKMLAWDMKRALDIHEALKDIRTDYTESGRAVYYFDANGRYDTKERLERLVDFLDDKGILGQTVLFEEPFDEKNEIYVGDIPCTFAADESVHNVRDVEKRISLGYRALTLKPIAKTLSLTMKMQECAKRAGIQSFCADLTVNPVMAEWNKCVAARLEPINGMKIGVVESNGAQNYADWSKMLSYLPGWDGNESGAIYNSKSCFDGKNLFTIPEHYLNLATKE